MGVARRRPFGQRDRGGAARHDSPPTGVQRHRPLFSVPIKFLKYASLLSRLVMCIKELQKGARPPRLPLQQPSWTHHGRVWCRNQNLTSFWLRAEF